MEFVVGEKIWKSPPTLEYIANGRFGSVHQVVSPEADKNKVVKILRNSTFFNQENLEDEKKRFDHEKMKMQCLHDICNKNMVGVHGCYIAKESHHIYFCIIVERCSINLRDYLNRYQKMTEDLLRIFAMHMVSALASMREKNLYPLILRPESILFGLDGFFKVGSFGNLKIAGMKNSEEDNYRAPEYDVLIKKIDNEPLINLEKYYMYSLGMIFYECLFPNIETSISSSDQVNENLNFLENKDLEEIIRGMIETDERHRATLNELCFSNFLLQYLFPSAHIIGKVVHFRQHPDEVKSTWDCFRAPPHTPNMFVVSQSQNETSVRSTESVGEEWSFRVSDLLKENEEINKEDTTLILIHGTHGKRGMEKGFNSTSLTKKYLKDSLALEEDEMGIENYLQDFRGRVERVDVGDYYGRYIDFAKTLHAFRSAEGRKIFVTAFCYATNSDVMKIRQMYKNHQALLEYLQNNYDPITGPIVEISGSIISGYTSEEQFPWEKELKGDIEAMRENIQLSSFHLNAKNWWKKFEGMRQLNANIVLMSFSLTDGNDHVKSFVEHLKRISMPEYECMMKKRR